MNELANFLLIHGSELLHYVEPKDIGHFVHIYRYDIVPYPPQEFSRLTASQAPKGGAVFGFRKSKNWQGHWDGAAVFLVNNHSKVYFSAIFENGMDYVGKWESTIGLQWHINRMQLQGYKIPMTKKDLIATAGL